MHIELREALLKLGQNKAAANHYEHALNLLEKEMDAKPSQRFVDFIKKIQSNSVRNNDLDLIDIEKNLEDEISSGALYCSIDYFKFLLNLQKRRSLRNDHNDYICVLTVNGNEDRGLKDLFQVLESSLRKGDVFTSWNENQVLILLHDVKENGIEIVRERLINNIREKTKISRNEISIGFQPIASEVLSF